VHPCLLDMLHDAANQHAFAVANRVDVHFYCVIEEFIQQHRRIVRDADCGHKVATQVDFVVDNLHCAAAQHIGGTHHQRIGDLFGFLNRLLQRRDGGVSRLQQLQALYRLLETFAVFCAVNRVRAGADNRYARCFQFARQFQRRLAAVLDDHALRLLDTHDFQHIFQRYRLEVEAVRGVVIGGDGLRVTVDHNGLVTIFAQRQRGVDAAVVKLNTLADTVWTTAEHHDFFAILVRVRFALLFIGGVHIGGVGSELRGAGINAFVDRVQVVLVAQLADLRFAHANQRRQTRIGKAFAFQLAQEVGVQAVNALRGNLLFQTHQLLNLHQEPAVDIGQVEDAINGKASAESVSDVPDTIRARVFQLAADFGQRFRIFKAYFRVEAGGAHFETAQRFLQRLLLGAANRHHFTNGFHLRGQAVVSTDKFFEVEARNFGDDIVDRGFERRRGTPAGDIVHQLIQRVTYRQFRRHFRNREAGRFRGQRRGA